MAAPQLDRRASGDDVRQHIINSLFWKKDEQGTAEETLITFIKVFEEDAPGQAAKTRYLMLAVTKLGKVVMHKAKRNANLSFSKGKTWNLEDLRILEVIGPTDFALTMTVRRYHWATERPKDQTHFLNSAVKVYKTYTKGETPELINFTPVSSIPAPGGSSNGNGGGYGNGNGQPPPPDRRPSTASPLPPHIDLAPPTFKTSRSGSASSVHSNYQAEPSTSARILGSYDDRDRASPGPGGPFGRSPLSDGYSMGGFAPDGRRPSAVDRDTERLNSGSRASMDSDRRRHSGASQSSIPPPPLPTGGQNGVGMGLPSHMRGERGPSLGGSEPPSRSRTASPAPGPGAPSSNPQDSAPAPSRPNRSAARASRGPPARDSGEFERDPNDRERPTGGSSSSLNPNSSLSRAERSLAPPPSVDVVAPPTITTTLASPSMPSEEHLGAPPDQRRRQRRGSFHPPPLTTAFSREVLLTSKTTVLPGAAGLTVDEGMTEEDAVMNNVEEMLDGFDWTAVTATNGEGGVGKKGADAIEGRLLDELAALDSANIHAFLESDDRIAQVLTHIDEALTELDEIDLQITGYRLQLNAVSDDISFIEGQNRGLQVQTSNQQALLGELRQLLTIVEVPPEDLRILQQESPGSQRGIQFLEKAATSLYKALQAGMDSANAEVSATIVRMREYQENSAQFCKRVQDYLEISFRHQGDNTLAAFRSGPKNAGTLAPHTTMGEYLMTYEGLVLYVKEMDEDRYQKLCSNYMSAASGLHQAEMKDLLMSFMGQINATAVGEPNEAAFATAARSDAPKVSAFQRSKAVIGLSKNEQAIQKERTAGDNSVKIAELYSSGLQEMINQIVSEEDFVNAFLHLTDTESTFADHMELDSYFRRQAARHLSRGLSVGMVQLVRSMMDLMFGFVDMELRNWVDAATSRNPVSIVGVLAITERLAKEAAQEDTSIFFGQMFDKLLARQHGALDAFVNEQLKTIDAAKTSSKRRKGVMFFIKHFPVFVERVEGLMEGNDDLQLRGKINNIYEKIVNAMFGSLQQLAKMDRAEGQAAEDKGQLNYNVIMLENMHHLVDDLSHLDVPALGVYLERARGMYEDNLSGYTGLILRRSFGRVMDFFDGVEKLAQSGPASEVSVPQNYSRSTLKKIIKDFSAKDLRKAVDAMSKRVDKHFADEEAAAQDASTTALINAVWRGLTQELKREVARDDGLVAKCYGDGGQSLEYGPGEVEAAFKRAR